MYVDNNSYDSGFTSDIWLLLSKYNLIHYITTSINTMELPSKLQWKRIVNKAVYEYEQTKWLRRTTSDTDFERFKILHSNLGIASLYKIPCIRDKRLLVHIARLWTMKPSIYRLCSFCGINVRDLLAHVLCDCVCKRPYFIQFYCLILHHYGYDRYAELMNSRRDSLIVKLLSLTFDTELPDETFPALAAFCYKT